MSSQDLMLGNNYLTQCQQLAHQATLAAAAASSIHNISASTPTTTTTMTRSPSTTKSQLQLISDPSNLSQVSFPQQQQQQQQQLQHHQHQLQASNKQISNEQFQWSQYQQAIASAIMSKNNAHNLEVLDGGAKDANLLDEQIRLQQQNLIAQLMNLGSNSIVSNMSPSSAPMSMQQSLNAESLLMTNQLNFQNKYSLQAQQQQLIAAMMQQQYETNNDTNTLNNIFNTSGSSSIINNNNNSNNSNNNNDIASFQQMKLNNLALQLCNTFKNSNNNLNLLHHHHQAQQQANPINYMNQTYNQLDNSANLLNKPSNNIPASNMNKTQQSNGSKGGTNGCRFNPMRSQQQGQTSNLTPRLRTSSSNKNSCSVTTAPTITTPPTTITSSVNNNSNNIINTYTTANTTTTTTTTTSASNSSKKNSSSKSTSSKNSGKSKEVSQTSTHIPAQKEPRNNMSASSLANMISFSTSNDELQPRVYDLSNNNESSLLAKLTSSSGNSVSPHCNRLDVSQRSSFDANSLNLLESLYSMNDEPEDDAIELISQRINSTSHDVTNWFQSRREAERNLFNLLAMNNSKNFSITNPSMIPPIDDLKNPCSSLLNLQPEANSTNILDNQILNYSNIQQSILESILGAANGNPSKVLIDSRTSVDPSDTGSHHEDNFDETDDDDVYNFSNNMQVTADNLVTTNNSNASRQTSSVVDPNTTNINLMNLYSANPFLSMIGSKPPKNSLAIDSPAPNSANNYKAQQPTVPSSNLLAKLSAVTTRSNAHIMTSNLDPKMIDLLEAFYAINDNPEQAAIEMIAKRINTTVEAISEWFDNKRIKTNPLAAPRSPPAKKREGGRVVTFSEYQRSLLEVIFDENNYLHPQEYEDLSNLIQVPSRNIKIWFKNRRSKQRLSGRITTPGSANSD